MSKKFKKFALAIFLLGALPIGLSFLSFDKDNNFINSPSPQVISAKAELTTSDRSQVTRVIDGDTIEIDNGQKVRLIGIDTPETVDPAEQVACFGKEASDETKRLLTGKRVLLEKDVSETDKYGRQLRYVFVDGLFLNDHLVRQGFAQIFTYPPDVKYQAQFLQAQNEARENNRGLWADCSAQASPSLLPQAAKDGCHIKGNISSSGEKIYHLEGQRYYSKTQIDESKGERWFCTENEAVLEGWRKSKV